MIVTYIVYYQGWKGWNRFNTDFNIYFSRYINFYQISFFFPLSLYQGNIACTPSSTPVNLIKPFTLLPGKDQQFKKKT